MAKKLDVDNILEGLDDDSLVDMDILSLFEEGGNSVKTELEKLPAQNILSGAKGKEAVRQRLVVLEINPNVCKPWAYYDRFDDWFNAENCKDLIDDISKSGQEIPGVVRKLPEIDDDGFEYEVVFGGRRHFASLYITNELGINRPFKAILKDYDDKEAARLMDMENRKRQDISGIERCFSYRKMLGKVAGVAPIFNSFSELLSVLDGNEEGKSITKSALSQMVTAAEILEVKELNRLFDGKRRDISWTHAYSIMQHWNSENLVVKDALIKCCSDMLEAAQDMEAVAITKALLECAKAVLDEDGSKGKQENLGYFSEIAIDEKNKVRASLSKKEFLIKVPKSALSSGNREAILLSLKKALEGVMDELEETKGGV